MDSRKQPGRLTEYAALLLVWATLVLIFGTTSKHFLSHGTLIVLANRIPPLTVAATGMTLVLIIGAIDLSVGSLVGLCGAILGALLMDLHWPLGAAVAACIAVGGVVGCFNGAVSFLLGIPSFIVTLGMLEVARGLAYLVTDSQTKYIGGTIEVFSRPFVAGGISMAFLLAIGLVLAGQVLLARTVFGRQLLAIGANQEAARLAGLRPRLTKMIVFTSMGLLAGIASVFYTSRLGSSDPNAGAGMELSAIAAVVIGGTSLEGGRGSVVNTFFGVLIIATLEAGLAQAGAREPLKRVITGTVIVVAVISDAWRHGGSAASFFRSLWPGGRAPRSF